MAPEAHAGNIAVRFLFYSTGVIGSLVAYGLLQERIMSQPYDGQYFEGSLFLVLCNRVCCMLFALTMVILKGEALGNAAPLWKYFVVAFSSVGASACQYDALKYISFPVQMLGKSFKTMPVMAWSMVVMKRRHPSSEWVIAACVTGGVIVFLLAGDITPEHVAGSAAFGLQEVAAFLALDGFTATCQEKLFKGHATSKYNQMLYINFGSTSAALIAVCVSGGFSSTWSFMIEHKDLILDAGMLSAAAVAGQWFIFAQVKEFGSLAFAATMNTRQVVSILLSYAVFGHGLGKGQLLGLVMVFAALFYKTCSWPLMGPYAEERLPLAQDVRRNSKGSCEVDDNKQVAATAEDNSMEKP